MIYLLISVLAGSALVWLFTRKLSEQRGASWGSFLSQTNEMKKNEDTHNEMLSQNISKHADVGDAGRAYRIGDMHFTRGNFEEAEKWFIKVLAIDRTHAEALNRLGVIYIQQGNPRRAEILYRTIFSITQKEPVYYCNYGRCLYNQGRFAEAIEAYENAIKLDARKAARYISLGQIHYEKKSYVKALECFSKALQLEGQNSEYLSLVADVAEIVGDSERQQKSLKKLLEIDPYNAVAKEKLMNMK